jgi:hypothetical protein
MDVIYHIKWLEHTEKGWKVYNTTIEPEFLGESINGLIIEGAVIIQCEPVVRQ